MGDPGKCRLIAEAAAQRGSGWQGPITGSESVLDTGEKITKTALNPHSTSSNSTQALPHTHTTAASVHTALKGTLEKANTMSFKTGAATALGMQIMASTQCDSHSNVQRYEIYTVQHEISTLRRNVHSTKKKE